MKRSVLRVVWDLLCCLELLMLLHVGWRRFVLFVCLVSFLVSVVVLCMRSFPIGCACRLVLFAS